MKLLFMRGFLLIAGMVVNTTSHAFDSDDISSTKDIRLDLADVFTFVDGDNIVLALTFGRGQEVESLSEGFNGLARYGLHIDSDGDYQPDHEFWLYADGGMQVGVRYGTEEVKGALGATLTAESFTTYAGLFHDPAFGDTTGWTLFAADSGRCLPTADKGIRCEADGEIAEPENAFEGKIVSGWVVRFPKSLLEDQTSLRVWGSSWQAGSGND